MLSDPHIISNLLYKRILGKLSDRERSELEAWISADPKNAELARTLTDTVFLAEERAKRSDIDYRRPEADLQRRVNTIKAKALARRASVAASIAVIIACAAWIFMTETPYFISDGPLSSTTNTIIIDSIKPGRLKAELSTTHGTTIRLDSLTASESTPALKDIAKNIPVIAPGEKLCLDVPRGGEFRITLSDSSVVWLNSESQLRFPETFGSAERRVHIKGEAYFEIRKDPERPFYVESMGQTVRVYGTTFNIKAYPDEEITYTTLESGSISLTRNIPESGELVLSPGHQACLDSRNSEVTMRNVKTSVITGWRHGRFVLEGQPFESIMRDLSRWYNFEYEFADPSLKDDIYLGSIPRYGDFKAAISILEKCGDVKFTTSGNRIIISRK